MLNIKKILKGLRILNDADQTKAIELNVSNSATTATKTTIVAAQTANRTITLPDSSGVLIDATTPQTLTNKTIVVASNTITTAASGNLVATELNAALSELQSDIDTRTTTVQFDAHLNDAVDAHDASAISNTPSGNLAATDVQAALNELQDQIDVSVGGANPQLSNLNTTSINQSLIPSSSAANHDIGHDTSRWEYGYFSNAVHISPTNIIAASTAAFTSPGGTVGAFALYGNTSAGVTTYNQGGATPTGNIIIESGNTGTAASGNISIRAGTTSGTRGVLNVDVASVKHNIIGVEVLEDKIGKNVTLTSNVTDSVISDFTLTQADHKSCIIQYTANVNGEKRTGTIHVSSTATNVAIADTFVETALTTLSFNAIVSAGVVSVRQTNTTVGTINISYKLTKFKE